MSHDVVRNKYRIHHFYRGRIFSNAVARGGRVYGLIQKPEAVDWAPRGPGAVESAFFGFWMSRFRPTELIIRVYTLYI